VFFTRTLIQNIKNVMNKYNEILKELSKYDAKLVLVSKTKPIEQILHYYNMGQKDFGENRVQEMVEKHDKLPKDIKWHQIGHLQKNKVKYIAPFVHLIHSVDSYELLKEINKRAKSNNRIINILLQIKIALEDTKFGMSKEECTTLLSNKELNTFQNIRICGLMGMATFTKDENEIRKEFKTLKDFHSKLKRDYFSDKDFFRDISMGMSSDYKLAIQEGATMVRIGSLIMGSRL